jgi:large subunit ribosomal protein L5
MSKEEQKKQQGHAPQGGGGHPDKGPKDGQKKQGGGGGQGKKPQGGPKKHAEPAEDVPQGPKEPPRLRVLVHSPEVRGRITEKFGIKNVNAMPKLEKIVLNVNMGRHLDGSKLPPNVRAQVLDTLTKVSGQKPVVIKAKKSVSNFKVRAGFETSAMVTLRRERMWHFLDRLINLATPRIKDFRGLPDKAFDKQGNYAMGLQEQGVFPEINMAEVEFTHGMNINMTFSNSNPERSRFVLEQLGLPFKKPEEPRAPRVVAKDNRPKPEAKPEAAAAAPAAAPAPAGDKK